MPLSKRQARQLSQGAGLNIYGSGNIPFLGDLLGGENVVAGDHAYGNSGLLTLSHSSGYFLANRIL
jgi:hypothetical protein